MPKIHYQWSITANIFPEFAAPNLVCGGAEEDVRRTVARRAVVPLECNLPEFCCQNLDIVKYVPLRDSTHIYARPI